MFARMIVLRKYFYRTDVLDAATMVFALDITTFELTERTVKRKGAMANDMH